MRHLPAIGAAFLLGCAANSGVVPVGPDTYMVSRQAATGFSGLGDLKAKALQEAQTYCASHHKSLSVVSARESEPPYILANFPRAEVQFQCLDENDPRLTRPRLGDGGAPGSPSPVAGTGTAFAVRTPSTLVTAFHVVSGARSVEVSCTGNQRGIAAIEKIDPANDLALLRIHFPAAAHLDMAPETSLSIGQRVYTIGFPVPAVLGVEAKYSDGSISSLTGLGDAANLLQVTVPVQPGNSGGLSLTKLVR